MKLGHKIAVVAIGGALSWGLAFCASIWTTWAVVLASLSTASTMTVGILTGWNPSK